MLPGLISFCLSRRPLVLISFAAFLAVGYAAFTALNIEAYPDPAPPIVEIIAQYPGQSPEEMERYVTIPLEIAVSSTPGLRFIRSNTVYALELHPDSVRVWPRLLFRTAAGDQPAQGRRASAQPCNP